MERLTLDSIQSHLWQRAPTTYKGDCGHVLVIGGNNGMIGAACMAAQAAARSGAGLVSIATRQSHAPLLSVMHPELMSHGVESARSLTRLLMRATVCVLGPGLAKTRWSKKMFEIVMTCTMPLIIDADGLNLLAKDYNKRDNWILTPHPGEAGRLLTIASSAVQEDRPRAAREIQKAYGGVCVLKGAGSLVCDTEGDVSIVDAGNPGMASGGMGDALSGVLAGLVAQGMELNTAARVGTVIHSTAADLAAAEGGERGLLATDLMPYIRKLVNVNTKI